MRKLDGAERHSKEVAAAIAAGSVRRAFLKGVGQTLGCEAPAAPLQAARRVGRAPLMDQPIVGFHLDDEGHWVAELACGHYQHVRHDPPWINRPWTHTSRAGRRAGHNLACRKCDQGAPRDLGA